MSFQEEKTFEEKLFELAGRKFTKLPEGDQWRNFMVKFPKSKFDRLRRLAFDNECTISSLIIFAVDRLLEETERY